LSLFILRETKKKGKKKKKKREKKSFTENMGFPFVLFTAFLIPPPSCSLCFGASVFVFWQ
jgi:hypothetical protein